MPTMVFGTILSSSRRDLSLQQVLDLSNIYLENACRISDTDIVMMLCQDTEFSLSLAKRAAKRTENKGLYEGVASIYVGLGDVLDSHGHRDEAQSLYKKSVKWGGLLDDSGRPIHPPPPSYIAHSTVCASVVDPSSAPSAQSLHLRRGSKVMIAPNIFPTNVHPPAIEFNPPEPDTRLNDTPQLACCLALLQISCEPEDIQDPATRNWVKVTRNQSDEQERLRVMATDVIKAFKKDEFKDSKAVAEVMYLAPVLDKDDFRHLLKEFCTGIDQSRLLDVHQLEGLAHLIQGADTGYLDSDDLVNILGLLSTRLKEAHPQSTIHVYSLTMAVSRVLDAMTDTNVKGLDRESLHEPLSSYLDCLMNRTDTYLVYQAAYAYQALLYVPDNESIWQATLRRTGKVIQGVAGIAGAVNGFNLIRLLESLKDIQQGLGVPQAARVVKKTCDGVTSLAQSGQDFLDCLKEGLSFSRKCAWYPALRVADTLIQDGLLADFRKLVCSVPCRCDAAFQWGICQRLGEMAANSKWNLDIRRSAIAFLGEIYRNDAVWGNHVAVKQWILAVLMQLSSRPGKGMQFAHTLLHELQRDGDDKKQTLYRSCLEDNLATHPLKVTLTEMGTPSLLDRVQERPDVEGNIRQLRRQRLKGRENAVYIQPQAKSSVQARDETRFPLTEKVEQFLASDHQVFLLLGDSGAGKSTFNRTLESDLWKSYKKTGAIPLFINLPAIDKPERDMIAKQLRKAEFTEPQIREMKLHRTFILICDGYDESQQTHNLYASNQLNQPGEWKAKMIISCRTEYLGVDYRDRFQPVDLSQRSKPALFQEAVITPFSMDQVEQYIAQYVSIHRPLWDVEEYKLSLFHIPSLKELVRNPFLMSLSLEVLPRIVDPGQDLSTTHVTRVALYDQFIEHWLERGKKRLGNKDLSPFAKAAFESLSDEGFTQNGIEYLKKLSVAIYKEQDGNPIVKYSRLKDDGTWKADFFSREDEKQLLREACPLVRSGNQYRFVHRSLLEYGVALAIFDPQDWRDKEVLEPTLARRGSTSSVFSSIEDVPVEDVSMPNAPEPGLGSPLAWRLFVKESSVLQFLEERVHQESLFKDQLLDYIEKSKSDRKWRIAAANAITILVRAGVQFNYADLQGIQIPYAHLSYGMFNSAQFKGADLRGVDFRGAWLRQVDLSNAQMAGVQFGELPFLEQEATVELCEYSADGMTITTALPSGMIIVHSTANWERMWILTDHDKEVTSIMYSPKDNRFVSGSRDATVRIWDVGTGRCHHVLCGHSDQVTSVVYSPRGDQVASGSHDCTVRIWDTEAGYCLHILTGHINHVWSVKYSPNFNKIISGSEDCTVRAWNTETGECSFILIGHESGVRMVVCSQQGDQIASISQDEKVRLWDVSTGDCRHILAPQKIESACITFSHLTFSPFIAFSPKGDQIASVSRDGLVQLWDVGTGRCLHVLPGHSKGACHIAYSPQGDLVASVGNDNTVRLWDTTTGVCHQTLIGHSARVSSAVFSPKGDQIASSSYDKTIRFWDVGSGASRHVSSGHSSSVWKVSCSSKGDQIVSCSQDMTVRLWDVEKGSCLHTLRGHPMVVNSVVFSPQGNQVATGSSDCTVRLWNVKSGICDHKLFGHRGKVTLVAFSPQGDQVASASYDKTVKLWDVASGTCRFTLEGHTGYVSGVVYSPSGYQAASWSWDGTARLWNVETGDCCHVLPGLAKWSEGVVYSPFGHHIASTIADGTIRLWDVATGTFQRDLPGDKGRKSITYSPDGIHLVSGSMDGSVKLWNVETGVCLQTFDGHDQWVTKTVYSPRGDLLATASYDKTVRLWDVASSRCVAVLRDFQGAISDITWIGASDGNFMATACHDGSVRMWRVTGNDDHWRVHMRWGSVNNALVVTGASIQDTQGLSNLNFQLLKQRGAVDEPTDLFREASRKVMTMASVVSRFRAVSNRKVVDPAPTASVSVEQSEEPTD